jgi:NAD(P)-dependent dehydrogenase (short-subunit alcohol dehydrogenase family)
LEHWRGLELSGKSNAVSYRSSKVALNMAVKALCHEVSDVSMSIVHPGWVQTDMGGAGGRTADVSVTYSAEKLLLFLTRQTIEDTGRFFDVISGDEMAW